MERLEASFVCLSTEPPADMTSDQSHLRCEIQDVRSEQRFPSDTGYIRVVVECLDGYGLLE